MQLEQAKHIIVNYLSDFPITSIALFGSFARDEHTPNSDIDILVSFSEPISLLERVRMHRELGELLNKKVDIVNEKYLHPGIKERITADLKVLASC